MDPVTVYAIWYKNERGEWVQYQSFDNALDADRAFQALERLGPARPIRLVLQTVKVIDELGEE